MMNFYLYGDIVVKRRIRPGDPRMRAGQEAFAASPPLW